jgi:hypothetical protein
MNPAVAADRHDRPLWIDQARRHGRGQPSAHGREPVIQQYRVLLVRFVIAGKPDLIYTIVERDNAIGRHDPTYFGDQARRKDRKTLVVRSFEQVFVDEIADFKKIRRVPRTLFFDAFGDLPDAIGDVAYHLELREIDRIDDGGEEIDVDDLEPPGRIFPMGSLQSRASLRVIKPSPKLNRQRQSKISSGKIARAEKNNYSNCAAVAVLAVAGTLLALSLSHLATGIALVTGAGPSDGWLMAIGRARQDE